MQSASVGILILWTTWYVYLIFHSDIILEILLGYYRNIEPSNSYNTIMICVIANSISLVYNYSVEMAKPIYGGIQ